MDIWLTIGLCFGAAGWAIIGWSIWKFGIVRRGPYPPEGWRWFWAAMAIFVVGGCFMAISPHAADPLF